MNSVFIFKTSVSHVMEIKQLEPVLDKLICPQGSWNFDLEDCDNILRVESRSLASHTITNTMETAGFYCKEL